MEKIDGFQTFSSGKNINNGGDMSSGTPKNPLSETMNSLPSTSNELKSEFVEKRIHEIVRALSSRTEKFKKNIVRPLSPMSIDSPEHSPNKNSETIAPPKEDEITISGTDDEVIRSRINSIFTKNAPFDFHSRLSTPISWSGPISRKMDKLKQFCVKSINPMGTLYMSWQFIVLLCYFYNCYGILLRVIFPYQTPSNVKWWLIADYCADSVYFLDIIIKLRVKMMVGGFWVTDPAVIPKYYVQSRIFMLDVLSLLPLDLCYLYFGVKPLFRLPRILKIQIYWDFFNKCDRIAKYPHIVRIARILLYMVYLIHLIACSYYAFSDYKGLGTNSWVFNGVGNAYIRCFLFALKTATSIGKNPKPIEEDEILFMTCSWLIGVFIFAILIGQIRDTLNTASKPKQNYQKSLDRIHAYMHRLNIPENLQKRISEWYEYNWQENKGEEVVLNSLPKKMKSDLALHIHFETLKKVQLFQGLETELLRELVLKLKPVLYLPGDYICRKGEVGTEMFIINSGKIEVMGGVNDDVVLVTLGEGSVFGEVSLLALAGGNRRSANVRSKGYSNIFVLNKRCLQETVKEYPEAQEILRRKAIKLMGVKKTSKTSPEDKEEQSSVVIENPKQSFHLINAVMDLIESNANEKSKESSIKNNETGLRSDSRNSDNSAKISDYQNIVHVKPAEEFKIEYNVAERKSTTDALDPPNSIPLVVVSCSSDDDRSDDEKFILSSSKYAKTRKVLKK